MLDSLDPAPLDLAATLATLAAELARAEAAPGSVKDWRAVAAARERHAALTAQAARDAALVAAEAPARYAALVARLDAARAGIRTDLGSAMDKLAHDLAPALVRLHAHASALSADLHARAAALSADAGGLRRDDRHDHGAEIITLVQHAGQLATLAIQQAHQLAGAAPPLPAARLHGSPSAPASSSASAIDGALALHRHSTPTRPPLLPEGV